MRIRFYRLEDDLIYQLGETVIDVNVEKATTDDENFIWKCTAFVGNSLLVEADFPYDESDKHSDVEFEFLRLVSWELSKTITNMLWGFNSEE
jgi:hypothetical protein